MRPRPRAQVPGRGHRRLGVQDRTIAVSPVGCAVFLYYYLDVGNTQAAHGRAPAVAIGHKLANPEAIVVSYQGDGDLASIGLAEILHAAQLGLPITVLFVNNAVYGMTGGQMAPTTLMGQVTATSPAGPHPVHGPAPAHGRDDRGPRRAGLCRASGPLRREAEGPGAEGHPEGPEAAGGEEGLRLRRGAGRVPPPSQDDARRGGAVGEGAARSRVPPGGQEGRARTRLVGRPAASAFRSRRAARGGGRHPGAAYRASPRTFRGRSSGPTSR